VTLLFTGSRDRLVGAGDRAGWDALLPNADHLTTDAGHQLLLADGFPKLSAWLRAHAVSKR